MSDQSELACVLSALILADTKQEITAGSINKVLNAAGVEVKPQWPILFSQFLQDKNVIDLITQFGAAPAAPAGDAAAPAAEEKKEEKKEETEEEIIAGFGFDDDDD